MLINIPLHQIVNVVAVLGGRFRRIQVKILNAKSGVIDSVIGQSLQHVRDMMASSGVDWRAERLNVRARTLRWREW